MIYTYEELKNKGLDNYNINKRIEANRLFKIETGLYSSTKIYNQLEYIVKKYPNSIFTLDSAFFYLGLTDYIPNKYFLATKHSAQKIQNEKVEQVFISNHLFEIGKIQHNYDGININIYNKERMLIELIRNKSKFSFDYYKEIINNYREIADEIDMSLIGDYLKNFINENNILETIQREVF
jgi:predicted transcriptional regulator of viral defense system